MRGALDALLGGPGLRRGRRDAIDVEVGDRIDSWRVEGFEQDRLLTLATEMKVPGRAWLQFEVEPDGRGGSTIRQTMIFDPVKSSAWLTGTRCGRSTTQCVTACFNVSATSRLPFEARAWWSCDACWRSPAGHFPTTISQPASMTAATIFGSFGIQEGRSNRSCWSRRDCLRASVEHGPDWSQHVCSGRAMWSRWSHRSRSGPPRP